MIKQMDALIEVVYGDLCATGAEIDLVPNARLAWLTDDDTHKRKSIGKIAAPNSYKDPGFISVLIRIPNIWRRRCPKCGKMLPVIESRIVDREGRISRAVGLYCTCGIIAYIEKPKMQKVRALPVILKPRTCKVYPKSRIL